MEEFNLTYVLLIPRESGRNSLFQGFSLGLTDPLISKLLHSITLFPNSILEIFSSSRAITEMRRRGAQKTIIPIYSDSNFSKLPSNINSPCTVIFCSASHVAAAKNIASRLQYSPIIASPSNDPSCLDIRNFPANYFIYSLDKALKENFLENVKQDKITHDFFSGLKLRKPHLRNLRKKSYISNNTRANEEILVSLGYKFKGQSPISGDRQNYIDAISTSADRARKKIGNNLALNQSDLIIYSPSIYAHLLNLNDPFWKKMVRNLDSSWKRSFVTKGIIKNPDYSGINMELPDPSFNPYQDPWIAAILTQRQHELYLNSLIISCLASNQLAPAIRLPNSVNFNDNILSELELHLGKDSRKSERIAKERFSELQSKFSNELGPKLTKQIKTAQSCLICSNAPLEWLKINDLPLMISHEISKIPVTPGNLFVHLSLIRPTIKIRLSQLFDVLIIRSFKDSDPIKHTLEVALDFWAKKYKNIKYKLIDVSCKEDVEQAIRGFRGKIVIFDCHGGHSGNQDLSWLQIGKEKLDTWSLDVALPPIVMLSACSTSPITGSHANAANGLFNSGAYSVIGTFLPVNSIASAAMIARILYRIDTYLPMLGNTPTKEITWRMCISHFLKMSFTTDLLRSLLLQERINQDAYETIHINANMLINSYQKNWFELFCEKLHSVSGIKKTELIQQISERCHTFETIYYTQLGRPENVIIQLESPSTSDR